jgi:hypothetical protein
LIRFIPFSLSLSGVCVQINIVQKGNPHCCGGNNSLRIRRKQKNENRTKG